MSMEYPPTPAKAGVHGEPDPPALWLRVKAMGACLAQVLAAVGCAVRDVSKLFRPLLEQRQS